MATLKEMQQALATHLTKPHSMETNGEQASLLSAFDADELKQSRETLVRKRLSQIASLLPRTRQALGSGYAQLCRGFISQHHFQGFRAPQLDAIHFARWLARQSNVHRWQIDLAAWEALRVEWTIGSGSSASNASRLPSKCRAARQANRVGKTLGG